MKNNRFLLYSLLLTFASAFLVLAVENKDDQHIRFATYNIRRKGKEAEVSCLWKNRVEKVAQLILAINPDIIGLQEPIQDQINDLEKLLPSYDWVGKSRNSDARGWHRLVINFAATDEFNPIFYNKDRILIIEQGTFSVDVGRSIPQHLRDLPRICTWALCQDRKSNKRFYVYNTHLDNVKENIRIYQITKIVEDIKNRVKGESVILMGDLNTNIIGGLYKIFVDAGFDLARTKSQKVCGPDETQTGWNNDKLKIIDHIIISRANDDKIIHYEVVESEKEPYPSDHRPVFADISMK